jgi:hypothetical protein
LEEKRVILEPGLRTPVSPKAVYIYRKMPNMNIKAVRKVPFNDNTISPGPVGGEHREQLLQSAGVTSPT